MKTKRMNRKKIIEEFESLRNLCLNLMTDAKVDGKEYRVMAFRAHHDNVDKMIVELGGESTKDIVDEIEHKWKEIDDKNKNGSTGNL